MNVIPLKNRIVGSILLLCCLFAFNASAQTPAKLQAKSILLLEATAHLGNGKVIPNAAVGFRNGKIDMVLASIDFRMDSTKYDIIIHLKGKHLYPGFIAPNSRLGLVEIDAVRASRDKSEVGQFKPHVRSLIAYNSESKITSTIRTNGVLIAEVAPVGGTISGTSSIFNLDGWNWEDAVLKVDKGIHLNWPRLWSSLGSDKKNDEKWKKRYVKEVAALKQFFKEAKVYGQAEYQLEKNLRFEAMRAVFNKGKKVFLHANNVQQITDALYFFDEYDVELVLVGGYDAWMISDLLKDRKIPVILKRLHSLPMNQDDAVDLPYKMANVLSKKGLLVALENSGDMEAMGTRNLPFYAGTAAAYGVEKEAALSMITLNTAKILGIDDQVGSIEEGKWATLFISEGDALDMRTNQVSLAYIQGKQIELTNPQ
ncbi:MAG: amidohydrolase family protein, partial [Flavobacteriales bacterium]|nr:amidohydrolase family protein [Flavobacteriales bacterium]